MNDHTSPAAGSAPGPASGPHVGLFATCLVDLMRPSVGFATVKLLEDAGCRISVPTAQACCGQPAYNSGDSRDARDIAKGVIEAFEGFDYVVAPSGSCAGMISHHYPRLFQEDSRWRPRAEALAAKTHELISFLVDVLKAEVAAPDLAATATYHDSCSGLRELGVKTQPRDLLARVGGLTLVEGKIPETCCGFGGLFCVKYPDISEKMVDAKADDVIATGADLLLAGDLGCLVNMAGRLKRRGASVQARHLAEVLAGMTDLPAIGEGPADDQEDAG
ncbi:MAG: Fe-S oxidoreductase [Rhodospirillales bacterium CG15_BIG_FIL_POST_REV_8_21_14_020_66_15]|nr:MAG: Fe-S oxidoreductase [Rhodospirillales bacterium CG15_BIG_FIL_POST_REV_8_21_14_020_66_15]